MYKDQQSNFQFCVFDCLLRFDWLFAAVIAAGKLQDIGVKWILWRLYWRFQRHIFEKYSNIILA